MTLPPSRYPLAKLLSCCTQLSLAQNFGQVPQVLSSSLLPPERHCSINFQNGHGHGTRHSANEPSVGLT